MAEAVLESEASDVFDAGLPLVGASAKTPWHALKRLPLPHQQGAVRDTADFGSSINRMSLIAAKKVDGYSNDS